MRIPAVRRIACVALTTLLSGLAATPATAALPGERLPSGARGAEIAPTRQAPEPPSPELERIVRKLHEAGAIGVTAEARWGDRVWATDSGLASLDPRQPAAPGSRFRAASITKPLVAVLALQLVEEGAWTLETTIGEAAPGLWPGMEAVTVRQLLSHTSGLPDYLQALLAGIVSTEDFLTVVEKRWTDEEILALVRPLPATSAPGTTFAYSNTNYIVVGQMLRRATGQTIRSLIAERILKPAKMQDSFFATGPRMPRPRLGEYARFPGEAVDLKRFQPSMFSSAGALVSTGHDLNLFHRALGRGRLVGKPLVRQMQTPALPGQAVGYGLGSFRFPSPCKKGPAYVNGHNGGSWGTLSFSVGLGKSRQVTVAMTGRGYRPAQARRQEKLLSRYAVTALAGTCGKAGTVGRPTVPRLVAVRVP